MTPCEQYLNAINELVDGTIGPLRRTELELHLETCDGCRALEQDLRQIATTARSLDTMLPPERIWTGIAERLQEEGRVTTRPGVPGRHYALLAMAAALVIAVGASIVLLTRGEPGPEAPRTTAAVDQPGDAAADASAAPVDPVQVVASELALTEKHFQNAIARADEIVDPQTKALLQKEWLLMTNALAESRRVLETDPQNLPARQSFYDTLRQKIHFLQDTIALMNEMRQGNAAGAAQIVEGGKS